MDNNENNSTPLDNQNSYNGLPTPAPQPVEPKPAEAAPTPQPVEPKPVEEVAVPEPVVTPSVEPTPVVQPVTTQDNNGTNNKKNNNLIIIIAALLVIIVIVFLVIKPFGKKKEDNKSNESSNSNTSENSNSNSNTSTNSNSNSTESNKCVNGVYSNDSMKITIYCSSSSRLGKEYPVLNYLVEEDKVVNSPDFSSIIITGSKAVGTEKSFVFDKNNNLIFEASGKTVTLPKTKEYTSGDFLKDYLNGDSTLFDGKYNNLYKSDNKIVVMYPVSSTEIAFYYRYYNGDIDVDFTPNFGLGFITTTIGGTETVYGVLTLKSDNTLTYEGKILDTKQSLVVTLKDNAIDVKYTTTDPDDKIKNINGTYTKSKTLTADDIILNKFYD